MCSEIQQARDASPSVPQGAVAGLMLIWAGNPESAPKHGNVVLWEGAARAAGVRSITEYIDAHAEEVRRRYLAWSHDLGETEILGRRLRERFKRSDGGSFWWNAVFVEQSSWKQSSLEPMLKLLALELLLEREWPTDLVFMSADRAVSRVLEAVCRRRGIRYRWTKSAPRRDVSFRGLLRGLPRSLQGMMALGYFTAVRWVLRRRPRTAADGQARRVLICGPFANHNATAWNGSDFASRYWGALPKLLARDGHAVHWLHYFYGHEAVPSARQARNILRRIDPDGESARMHSFVESYLPVHGIATVFGKWLAIAAESLIVGWFLRRAFKRGSYHSYWPLIRDDWAKTFRGFGCVQNLFYAECFDQALKRSGRYQECIYLMENQGWERALAQAWHRYNHGRLTGVAHSTVRFWDLRYHCDPRRYGREYRGLVPAPDSVVLNGRAARDEYLATCACREQVAECEALRYQHLIPGRPRILEVDRDAELKVLLLGDYTRERTEALLQVMERACHELNSPIEVWVKTHPGCPVDASRFRTAKFALVNDSVAALVPSAHLVLASNTTSAALEAYVCGGRVLVLDDRRGVNYSPLLRVRGAAFVCDANDVCRAIRGLQSEVQEDRRQTDEFFNIDPELPRWRRYFGAGNAESGPVPGAEKSN